MNYIRVIPRDLFNEAKLLKCVGHLVLQIHDNNNPCRISFEHDDESFKIGLLDEGYLTVRNITFTINNKVIQFVSQYNAKSNFPFYAYHEYCEYLVFDESGKYTDDFINFCSEIN